MLSTSDTILYLGVGILAMIALIYMFIILHSQGPKQYQIVCPARE